MDVKHDQDMAPTFTSCFQQSGSLMKQDKSHCFRGGLGALELGTDVSEHWGSPGLSAPLLVPDCRLGFRRVPGRDGLTCLRWAEPVASPHPPAVS